MGFFSRLFNVAKAEGHSAVDKMEDPIKMTEQGIRDLKNDLSKSMESLAEVKASANSLQKKENDQRKRAEELASKAKKLLEKAKEGNMDPGEADRLAKQALTEKSQAEQQANQFKASLEGQQKMTNQLQDKVNHLQDVIRKQENKLTTLKARSQTADSLKKVNKQLSTVDSSSTTAMLERMEEKVDADEAKAQAYSDLAESSESLDSQIDSALDSDKADADDELANLKKDMGL